MVKISLTPCSKRILRGSKVLNTKNAFIAQVLMYKNTAKLKTNNAINVTIVTSNF